MTAEVQLKKNLRESLGAWSQDELIGGKPPVVKSGCEEKSLCVLQL
jgi:hypothetical protein